MSVASSLTDDNWETDSSGGRASLIFSDDDGDALPAVDQYNPHDLVKSWTKVAPAKNNHVGSRPEQPRPKQRTVSRRLICWIVVALVIVIVVMVVTIVVIASGDAGGVGGTTDDTTPPFVFPPTSPPTLPSPPATSTSPPTSSPPTFAEQGELFNFLASISFDSGEALADAESPQHKAFEWLASETSLVDYSDLRKVQRYVLATLYFSTSGDQWFFQDGWLSNEHECDWQFGQFFDEPCGSMNERIIDIGMPKSNLNGTLPPEIGLLSDNLFHLELQDNFLYGSIPSEIASLTKLRLFNLADNHAISGSIPTEMGEMKNLARLVLDNGDISGTIPEELWSLPELKVLRLVNNMLVGTISPRIGSVKELQILSLNDNGFTGSLPIFLGLLTSLVGIDLSANNITGQIPSELGLMQSLDLVYLNGNNLSGTIPTTLGSIWSLIALHLDSNDLEGSVPSEICRLGITDIEVDCGEVFCNCCGDECLLESLKVVSPDEGAALSVESSPQYHAFEWLATNPSIEAYQPHEVVQRYAVATLYFSMVAFNDFENANLNMETHECSWGFPGGACDSAMNVVQIELDEIGLGGSLPPELALLSNSLKVLSLSVNSISGRIPSEMGLLAYLQILDLTFNILTGPLPTELGTMSNLKYLFLTGNNLTGEIPSELGDLSTLESIFLNENAFTGSVPSGICDMDGVIELSVDCEEVECSCCELC